MNELTPEEIQLLLRFIEEGVTLQANVKTARGILQKIDVIEEKLKNKLNEAIQPE